MAIKTVIGLEMHCEFKSNSKVFSKGRNSYSELANSNVAPVDMAFPGTLPVVNKYAVEEALMMAMVLNCKTPDYIYFDRKNYYYPDLPKGYQITQYHNPVGVDGYVDIEMDGYTKRVSIYDIHLEEDTASMEHNTNGSLIDYNRAGVPLVELVTNPVINSKEEAVAFLEHIRRTYQYCGVSDADSKKGQVRCDVNISIMEEGSSELGTRVEIKNINSFSGVRDAIEYEVNRQKSLMEAGKYDEVVRETRRWDEESGVTITMRSKEEAIDYKLFVEPNLPKFKVSSEWLDEIRTRIPVLASDRKKTYIEEYGLSDYDATVITKEVSIANYFEECVSIGIDPKTAANWLTVQITAYLNKEFISIEEFYLTPSLLLQIIKPLKDGIISSKQAKEVFTKALEENKEPKNFISSENAQISDKDEITKIIDEILSSNEGQVEAYRNGRSNLFDFFVGQVMKATRGKANPVITKEVLKEKLDN